MQVGHFYGFSRPFILSYWFLQVIIAPSDGATVVVAKSWLWSEVAVVVMEEEVVAA